MSKTKPKHTQGSWSVVYREDKRKSKGRLFVRKTFTINAQSVRAIATLKVLDENESFYNAHLMATGPEMLEALENLIEDMGPELGRRRETLEAIVAKAKGKKS
jgi:hypothetical protein